jgi:plastocyanin
MMRPRSAIAGAAVALAAGLAPAAHAATTEVMIPGTTFLPSGVRVLQGDTVQWMNHDTRPHTATADGGAFDTGSIPAGADASVAFPATGSFAYTCRIHPFMHGTVDVVALFMAGPSTAPAKGAATALAGRVAAALGNVTLERRDGAAWTPVATTAPGADGAFAFSVRLTAPATFRAHAGTATTPPVTLRPVDLALRISATRHGRRTYRIGARVLPRARGTLVVFQRYVPERFAWRTLARRRTDATGLVRISVRTVRRLRVRAVVRTGGAEIASRTVRIGTRPPFG